MERKNIDIAYFIGVLQTDASLFSYTFRGKIRSRYILDIGKKSIPMLKEVRRIFSVRFGRLPKIRVKYHLNENPTYLIEVNIKTLKGTFSELGIDKNKIPDWIKNSRNYFGAYLAGIIDGDGDICIKRPRYPQCEVRITAGKELKELTKLIVRHLECSCRSEIVKVSTYSLPRAKIKFGLGYRHRFYISQKNIKFIKKFVYPFIRIKHKKRTLGNFFKIQSIHSVSD